MIFSTRQIDNGAQILNFITSILSIYQYSLSKKKFVMKYLGKIFGQKKYLCGKTFVKKNQRKLLVKKNLSQKII